MSFVDATGMRVGGLHDVQVSDAASGWSRYPDVVWTGTQFGVMYVDTRDGAPDLWLQSVACARGPRVADRRERAGHRRRYPRIGYGRAVRAGLEPVARHEPCILAGHD